MSSRALNSGSCLKTEVLIIGAGPSGLMAAQALGRLGIDVTVVERRAPGEVYGNADGLQPRTLEIWKGYEMYERITAKGALMIGMVGYERDKGSDRLVRSKPSNNVVVGSRYPYEITASILDIEATLRENAEEAHVKFIHSSWPVSLEVDESLCQDKELTQEYPVKVTVASASVRERGGCTVDSEVPLFQHTDQNFISAKYVIGADGAYSWVRRTLGVAMEGEQTEDIWGVADVILKTDFPDVRFKCIVQASLGPLIIVPREGDKVRIYIGMTATDQIARQEDGRLDKSTFSASDMRQKILEQIRERLAPYIVEFTHVFWSTVFSTAQKVASTFSYKNKVFIVGDACHTHSPKAGQGANASMGDAHNLCWKLAYVLRGWASPAILETYEDERREYALALISFDKVVSSSLEDGTAEDYQRLLQKQNLFTSGTGITYALSKLTIMGSHKVGQVFPGERFPFGPIVRLADWHPFDAQDLVPSDGKFKLIILPGNLLHPKLKANLLDFAFGLQNTGRFLEIRQILTIYTVAYNLKEDITWCDIPHELTRSWKCCFTIHEAGLSSHDDLYKKFGISDNDQTAAVLVRPDGYISLIAGLECQTTEVIVSYICNL